ncbi:BlaI/MecI/CopY family transcriptional regulator [Massilia sp. CMS3.1]|uniref:BlaI/MecI/CopY family transcriptional regulator n=1 Tax=Massilia sp. CMS3.1 TaxID=3373083 RepID=UPI003EE702EB
MNDDIATSISAAESRVMDILWHAASPLTADQIIAALADTEHWQAVTVKTLLNRLLKKGAIGAQKDGRRFLYHAVLQRDAWLSSESESLLQRLFGGRIAPLVAHFGSRSKLSQADIHELRKLIDELDDGE